jgi:hypothetical protein
MDDLNHPLVGPDQETIRIATDRRSLLMRCRDARLELPLRGEQFSALCGICVVFTGVDKSIVEVYQDLRGYFGIRWESKKVGSIMERSTVTHHDLEAVIGAAMALGLVVRCP